MTAGEHGTLRVSSDLKQLGAMVSVEKSSVSVYYIRRVQVALQVGFGPKSLS